ncbi:MAG: hypothetical protein HY657_19395 [Acidobacteria bacterium]|nr:hypothetical protein [Acidobacteriota bacterium]
MTAGARAQDAAKGQVLLAAARQALGGESRLAGVKTLQVTGTFRRVIGNDDTDGDFEVFLERPDKYLRSEKTGTPGQPSTETIEALVGTEIRDEVRGGGGRVGRGGAIGGGDAPPDGAPPAEIVAEPDDRDAGQQPEVGAAGRVGRGRGGFGLDPDAQRRARQADVARLLLMWLLATDAPMPWVGIAESPDGKAEVLEARFADGQPTRLFLDAVSYMPLMLQWQGLPARAGGPGGRPFGAAQGRRGLGGQRGRGQAADAGAAGAGGVRRGGAAEPITFDMTFSDHRVINGIRLPHTITRGMNGQTIERWTIRSYRVNPSFDAETFTR